MMRRSASFTNRPVYSGTVWSKAPSTSTGLRTGRPSTRPTAASSSPKAGAMWTIPEPSSVLTNSAATTRWPVSSIGSTSIGRWYRAPASSDPVSEATTSASG